MSRKPSNAEQRRRLRRFSIVDYGVMRHAVDNVPCPVCGSPRYAPCGRRDPTYMACQLHTPRLLLSRLIPVGDSLLEPNPFWVEHKSRHDEQEEFIRLFGEPTQSKAYPKR